MKIVNIYTMGLVLTTSLHAATVNFVQNSQNDADASVISAVSSNQYLETAVSYTTVIAPSPFNTYCFTHWTNSSAPATAYRDAWGRSLNPISFTLYEATTATAHYLPATRDTDVDGVPDGYEIESDLTKRPGICRRGEQVKFLQIRGLVRPGGFVSLPGRR